MQCVHPGCEKPVASVGLCKSHYQHAHYMENKGKYKAKRYRKLTDYSGVRVELRCMVEGCSNPEFNPGLCAGHYYQRLRGEELRPLRETAPCPVAGCDNAYTVKRSRSKMCLTHTALGKKYGLPPLRLQELLAPQACSNPGCGEVTSLHIDHDHACCPGYTSCGKCVRGVLCAGCNQSLGSLQENPQRIRGLLDYLARVQPGGAITP